MIATRDGITVQHREQEQPCAVCGVSTPYYASFISIDGKLTVWAFCTLECYEQRHNAYADILRNREWSWCAECVRSL